jgi:hypothetical protein
MRRSSAVSVAVIVPTPELLKQMVNEKPACWTWAAFASVVFQRWGALEVRKIDQVLGSPVHRRSVDVVDLGSITGDGLLAHRV